MSFYLRALQKKKKAFHKNFFKKERDGKCRQSDTDTIGYISQEPCIMIM